MAIWKTEPVSIQPEITLRQWRAKRLPDDELHLVGFCVENVEGRVSSAVQQIDPVKRIAVTRSGRAYRLLGPPGHNSDAAYVWSRWADLYGVSEVEDVSEDIHAAMASDADDEEDGRPAL